MLHILEDDVGQKADAPAWALEVAASKVHRKSQALLYHDRNICTVAAAGFHAQRYHCQ